MPDNIDALVEKVEKARSLLRGGVRQFRPSVLGEIVSQWFSEEEMEEISASVVNPVEHWRNYVDNVSPNELDAAIKSILSKKGYLEDPEVARLYLYGEDRPGEIIPEFDIALAETWTREITDDLFNHLGITKDDPYTPSDVPGIHETISSIQFARNEITNAVANYFLTDIYIDPANNRLSQLPVRNWIPEDVFISDTAKAMAPRIWAYLHRKSRAFLADPRDLIRANHVAMLARAAFDTNFISSDSYALIMGLRDASEEELRFIEQWMDQAEDLYQSLFQDSGVEIGGKTVRQLALSKFTKDRDKSPSTLAEENIESGKDGRPPVNILPFGYDYQEARRLAALHDPLKDLGTPNNTAIRNLVDNLALLDPKYDVTITDHEQPYRIKGINGAKKRLTAGAKAYLAGLIQNNPDLSIEQMGERVSIWVRDKFNKSQIDRVVELHGETTLVPSWESYFDGIITDETKRQEISGLNTDSGWKAFTSSLPGYGQLNSDQKNAFKANVIQSRLGISDAATIYHNDYATLRNISYGRTEAEADFKSWYDVQLDSSGNPLIYANLDPTVKEEWISRTLTAGSISNLLLQYETMGPFGQPIGPLPETRLIQDVQKSKRQAKTASSLKDRQSYSLSNAEHHISELYLFSEITVPDEIIKESARKLWIAVRQGEISADGLIGYRDGVPFVKSSGITFLENLEPQVSSFLESKFFSDLGTSGAFQKLILDEAVTMAMGLEDKSLLNSLTDPTSRYFKYFMGEVVPRIMAEYSSPSAPLLKTPDDVKEFIRKKLPWKPIDVDTDTTTSGVAVTDQAGDAVPLYDPFLDAILGDIYPRGVDPSTDIADYDPNFYTGPDMGPPDTRDIEDPSIVTGEAIPSVITPSPTHWILTEDQLKLVDELEGLGYKRQDAKDAVLGNLEKDRKGLTPAGGVGELPIFKNPETGEEYQTSISAERAKAIREEGLDISKVPTHPFLNMKPNWQYPEGRTNKEILEANRLAVARAKAQEAEEESKITKGQASIDRMAAEARRAASLDRMTGLRGISDQDMRSIEKVGETYRSPFTVGFRGPGSAGEFTVGFDKETGKNIYPQSTVASPDVFLDQVRQEREQFAANQPIPGAVFSEGEWFSEGKKYKEPDFTVPFPTESESARRRRLRSGGTTVLKG